MTSLIDNYLSVKNNSSTGNVLSFECYDNHLFHVPSGSDHDVGLTPLQVYFR